MVIKSSLFRVVVTEETVGAHTGGGYIWGREWAPPPPPVSRSPYLVDLVRAHDAPAGPAEELPQEGGGP